MVDQIDPKALIASRQFWLMVALIVGSVLASPEVLNLIPNNVVVANAIVAVIGIIIRYMTDAPITGVVSAK